MKFLITADWHINDYKNFNYSVGSRLAQFETLAHQTVELGKVHDTPVLIIAGDFIDIPVMSPKIQHTVKNCLDILKSGFTKIYYILGQHDLDTKGTVNKSDTILTLYDDEKFIYMDSKVIDIDGFKIGFQNWTPQQDTSWIEEKLDVLIGHYTKSNLFGQEIDESKFNLMIHGDIHNSQVIGRFISICNPIQKDMSSEASGSMIVLDTKATPVWRRIKVDEPHQRYLRIEYTNDPDKEGWESEILYKVYKPLDVSSSGEPIEISIPEWSEIDELTSNIVGNRGLLDIHGEVLAKTQEYQEVDFNFHLKYLIINNYRSIETLRIDFDDKDLILLLGNNGSGKSSIISALQHLFYYDTHLDDNASDFNTQEVKRVQLEMGLIYQDKYYIIKKGVSWGLTIDGEEIGFPSKPKFEKALPDYLPFLNYLDVFFISSEVSNLTGTFTSERRSELLSKFYKFDKILTFSEKAYQLRDLTVKEFDKLNNELRDETSKKNYIEERMNSFDIQNPKSFVEKEIQRLEDLKRESEKYSEWCSKLDKLEGALEIQKETLKGISKPIHSFKEVTENYNNINSDITLTENLLTEENKNLTVLTTAINEYNLHTESSTKLHESLLKLGESICPLCGSTLSSGSKADLIKSTKGELEELEKYFSEIGPLDKLTQAHQKSRKDVAMLTETLSELKKKATSYKEELNSIEVYSKTLEPLEKSIAELTQQRESLWNELTTPKTFSEEDSNSLEDYHEQLRNIENYEKLEKEKEIILERINSLSKSIDPIQQRLDNLSSYALMMAPTGDVYSEILKRLAKSFSSDKIQWYIEEGTYRNKDFLIFQARLKVANCWRAYDSLSAGQKNLVDLDFLNKMIAVNSGLLVLDETLKHLDAENSVEAAELISKFKVNTLLIATHSISFPQYTKKLLLSLDNDGKTIVNQ